MADLIRDILSIILMFFIIIVVCTVVVAAVLGAITLAHQLLYWTLWRWM